MSLFDDYRSILKHPVERWPFSMVEQWDTLEGVKPLPGCWDSRFRVLRFDWPMPHWPEDAPPLTLLHTTDWHVERATLPWLEAFVDWTNRQAFDVLIYTGDSITKGLEFLPQLKKLLDALPSQPKFACPGNHDLADGRLGRIIFKAKKAAGMKVLNNAIDSIPLSGNKKLQLVGLDDYFYGGPNWPELRESLEADQPTLLLVHNPAQFTQPYDWSPASLALSGHTHGGQFAFPHPIKKMMAESPYIQGLYRVGEKTGLFVNAGMGTAFISKKLVGRYHSLVLPRLGIPPEVAFITLKPAPKL